MIKYFLILTFFLPTGEEVRKEVLMDGWEQCYYYREKIQDLGFTDEELFVYCVEEAYH